MQCDTGPNAGSPFNSFLTLIVMAIPATIPPPPTGTTSASTKGTFSKNINKTIKFYVCKTTFLLAKWDDSILPGSGLPGQLSLVQLSLQAPGWDGPRCLLFLA